MALEHLTSIEGILEGDSLEMAKNNEIFGESLQKAVEAIAKVREQFDNCRRLEPVMPDLASRLNDVDHKELLEIAKNLDRLALDLVGMEGREALESSRYRIDASNLAFSKITNAFIRAWYSMVDETFSSDKHLGAVLKNMPDMGNLGSELTKIAERGLLMAKESPSADRLTLLRELEGKATACRARLGGVEGAEEVTTFLVGVAQGTVTLANLTPPILEWLSDQGLLEHFFVNVG